MKIAEKGGYKRVCRFYFRKLLWMIIIPPAVALFYGRGTQRVVELFIGAIIFSILLWILISVMYGLFFFITKPFQKKQGLSKVDVGISQEKKIINKENNKVSCKGCGEPLPQSQIDFMLGNPQYNEWYREGFCRFACFEQYRKDNNKRKAEG